MTPSVASQYVILRGLVGFLGEKSQKGWWDTDFLGKTGRTYLKLNFPRSYLLAGIMNTGEAARIVHDERIGGTGRFHLFRLPHAVEELVFESARANPSIELEKWLESGEQALAELKRLEGATVHAPEGPVQIGTTDKLDTDFTVQEMARHYADAFERDIKCFPYLTGATKGNGKRA